MGGGQILRIAEAISAGAGASCSSRASWTFGALSACRRLVLYGCLDQVLRIFTVAGLTDAGIVFGSRAEAIAELAVVE